MFEEQMQILHCGRCATFVLDDKRCGDVWAAEGYCRRIRSDGLRLTLVTLAQDVCEPLTILPRSPLSFPLLLSHFLIRR